jgi:hypothetical protein
MSVPYFLRDVLKDVMAMAEAIPQPGREELAKQVRAVAAAQGHLELRGELIELSALCLTWAAWLPGTVKVPQPEEVAAP